MNRITSFTCLLLFFLPGHFYAQNICPSINAGADVTICNGQCTQLLAAANANYQTTGYIAEPIAYTPLTYTGTTILVNQDDIWSPVINLGFNFCYYGITYDKVVISANGQVSFNQSSAGLYNAWAITKPIPDPSNGKNTISVAYRDINPATGGSVFYKVQGSAPCRSLVISWVNIPLFNSSTACNGIANSTFQVVLYETTNIIDVNIQNSSACTGWNSGAGIIGLQDSSGTIGTAIPSRNYPYAWTAINESWRFSPNGVPSYTVTWSDPGGVVGTGLSFNACPSTSTTYTAAMALTNCDGVVYNFSDSVRVSVNSVTTSTTNIQVNSATLCLGSSATLTATGGTVYSWSPVTGLNTVNGATVVATPSVTTIYTVTGSSGSCADTSIAVVNVNFPPLPVLSFSNDSLCSGSSVTLSASGGTTYTWSPASSLSSTSGATVTASPTVTTSYTVQTSSGGCLGTVSAVTSIKVISPITSGTITSTPPTCNGSCNGVASVTVTGGGGNKYLWSTSAATSSISSLCPGTYSVQVSNAICPSSYTASTSITAPPPVQATATATGCTCLSGGNGSLTVSPSGGSGSPFTFSINGGSYGSSAVFGNLIAGNYTLSVKDKNGCPKSLVVTVPQSANNAPAIYVNSDTICLGSSVTLTASGASTYSWSPATGLSGTTGTSVTANPIIPVNYTVSGTDASNCKGSAIATLLVVTTYTVFSNGVSVCVKPADNIVLYNSFSPNGDGLNDLFEIDNIEQFVSNHVYIYNRWGQLLWERGNYDNKNVVWDGRDSHGQALPPGTYYYLVEVSGKKTEKHWLELVR